jgi:hypothetical protein
MDVLGLIVAADINRYWRMGPVMLQVVSVVS